MKYIALILTLTALTAQANDFKMVNGVRVELTDAEQAVLDSARAATIADSSNTGKRQRFEDQIIKRTDKLTRVMSLMGVRLTANQFENFVQATRNERADYIYTTTGLITWFNVTFPTRNYYDADLQTRALNILQ